MKGKILFSVIAAIIISVPVAIGERADEVKSLRFDKGSQPEVLCKAGIPHLINYQGYLTDVLGNPTTDTLEMTFSIWDDPVGGNQLWSEFITSVPVINGLFSATLGDATSIPDSVFAGIECWLETKIGEETLSPRKQIVSVGYSFRAFQTDIAEIAGFAEDADKVDGYHVSDLDTQYVNEGQSNSITSAMVVDGTIQQADLAFTPGGLTLPYADSTSVSGDAFSIINYGTGSGVAIRGRSDEDDGIVGWTGASNKSGIYGYSSTGAGITGRCEGDNNGIFGATFSSNSDHAGVFGINNGSGPGVYGEATDTNAAGVYGKNEGIGDGIYGWSKNRYGVWGVTTSQDLTHAGVFGDGGYTHGVYGRTLAGSAHGVHGEAGAFSTGVGVYGESSMGNGIVGKTNAYDKNGVYGWSENGVGVSGRGDANDGVVGWTGDSDKSGVYGHSDNGVGVTGRSGNNHGIFGATFSSSSNHAGVFGRNNGSGPGVYGEATGTDGEGVYGTGDVGVCGVGLTGVLAQANAGGTALWAAVPAGYGTAIYAERGPSGGYAAEFKGNVVIKSHNTGSTVIELGEGLDYAEGFDVSDKTKIMPGTVLIIDPDQPGKLTISDKPYDSKVAGIVAGAAGLGSGVRLGAGFDYDIALAGRVYCNVDAAYGEVKPGDLLTTSPTPGYAMVVKNYSKARGAILGKAMEALPEGAKVQILVLVTLQ